MRSRLSLLSIAAVGALALAACGGSDGDSSADTAASAAETTTTSDVISSADGSAAPATDPPATDPPATDPPATDPPATDPPATDPPAAEPDVDGSCLVGEWVVSEEEMNKFYDGIEETVEAPLTLSVEGSAPLTFNADGTYRWDPDFILTVEVAGTGGTGEASGDITGNWSASEGVLTTESDINALEVSITVAGVTIDGADLANGFLNSSPINGVTYSCDGSTPVLDFLTGDPDVTVPVSLMPA